MSLIHHYNWNTSECCIEYTECHFYFCNLFCHKFLYLDIQENFSVIFLFVFSSLPVFFSLDVLVLFGVLNVLFFLFLVFLFLLLVFLFLFDSLQCLACYDKVLLLSSMEFAGEIVATV
uniref:Uncharacterized protein n=1 Tax=Cacopsylla melanoneura TaxID=428564 RepID=A0A8D8QT37_9HEMI